MTEKLTKAQERIKTALAHFIDLKHPVAMAVEPLREKVLARAEKEAREIIAKVAAEVASVGNDLNKCAPYPNGNMQRNAYRAGVEKYQLFCSLTKSRETTGRPGQPRFADMSDPKCAKFIELAKKEAAWQYDAFIVKLCTKIGVCNDATLDGDHVWAHSHLHVMKNGKNEVWKTQQIVNVSKLGRLFNQWPSRKLKR